MLPTSVRLLKEHIADQHWVTVTATKGQVSDMDSSHMFPAILTSIFAAQLSGWIKNSLLLVLERLWTINRKSLKNKWMAWHERLSSKSFDIRNPESLSPDDRNFTQVNILPAIRPALELVLRTLMLTEGHMVSKILIKFL